MPKLLRKNIYDIRLIIVLTVLQVIWLIGGVYIVNIRGIEPMSLRGYFTSLNWVYWIVFHPTLVGTYMRFSLPEFFYVAPFSGEDREKLIRRGIAARFRFTYLTTLLIVILPIGLYSFAKKDGENGILCVVEAVLVFALLYSGCFIAYIEKCNVGAALAIQLAILFICAFFAGLQPGIDMWLIGFIIILSITIVLVCRIRYYNPMVCYLADYERSRLEES